MSLFEWLGESFNPGSVGAFHVRARERRKRRRIDVLGCLVLSCFLIGIWICAIWGVFEVQSLKGLTIAAGGTLAYLIIAYFVHPQPDAENMGWFGGLWDHPFRISDDINRSLVVLLIVLWPGRFIAESIVDSTRLLLHARDRRPRKR